MEERVRTVMQEYLELQHGELRALNLPCSAKAG